MTRPLIVGIGGTTRTCYLEGRAVGLIVVAAGWQACGTTLSALRDMVHAMRGWPTPIGITVNPSVETPFGPGGQLVNPDLRALVEKQAEQIMGMALRDLDLSRLPAGA